MFVNNIFLAGSSIKRKLPYLFLLGLFLSFAELHAQCPAGPLTISHTNVLCFGQNTGSVSVTVNNTGTFVGNYNYTAFVVPVSGAPFSVGPITTTSASQTFTNLPASTVFVVVSPQACSNLSGSDVVTQPPSALVASASQTAVMCNGGTSTVTITASGGTGPYTGTGAFPQTAADGTVTYTVTDANGCTDDIDVTITEPAALIAAESHTAIACNGGTSTVTITGSGGVAPYTGIGNFPQTAADGTVIYTVTDANGCTDDIAVTIAEPAILIAAESHTAIACNGGTSSVTITASGGTGPYSGIGTFPQTVADGTVVYTVTDANGCTDDVSVTLTEPVVLSVSESHTAPICGFSNVTITASGGTAPYSGDGVFIQAAGTTTYIVTDANGCSAQIDVTIAPPAPVVAAESHTPILCNGGTSTVTITATGGVGGYTGTGTFIQTAADGTVTYTVTDANGCSDDIAVTIAEPTVLVAAESHTAITCNGGTSTVTITASGGVGPYTGIGNFPQTAADGTVIYTVTDANGCTDDISVTITQPNVLIAAESHTAIACNGGTSTVTITASGGTGAYTGTGTFSQTVADGTVIYTVTDANGCTDDISVTLTEPTVLIAAESHTAVLCNGGTSTVTITASGGTGAYTGTGTFPQTAADGTVIYTVTDANGCTDNISVTITEPAVLIAAESHTAIACNGGTSTVTITASGGVGPYTGIGAFPQTAADGTVIYTVTDANGCTDDISVTIAEPAILIAAESHTAITCNGGTSTVTITASGGVGPYTGTGAFPQTAGDGTVIYTVTDANGCTDDISVTITEPTVLVAAESHTAVTCNGGTSTVTITASGGVGPYTGTGAFPQTAADGTVIYTVTDANGCTDNISVTITEPAVVVAAESHTAIACNGGTSTVTITASGGVGPYTGTGTFPQTAADGTVIYTVTDANGCTDDISVTITEPAVLIAAESHTAIACNGGTSTVTITASGGVGPYTGIGAFPQTAADGTVVYTVTDANGCTDDISVTLTEPTVLIAAESHTAVTCNGGTSTVTITASGGTGAYTGTGTFSQTAADGTVIYTVTDANGCTDNISVTITEPTVLVAAESHTAINCNGGASTVTITASGGTGAYTGTGTFSQTAADGTVIYTVTDANGCTDDISVTITEPAVLVAAESHTAIACNGAPSTVTITATGGTGPYTGTGNFLQTAGTTTYTVTDANGCTDDIDVTVVSPSGLLAAESHTAITCNGGTSTVTITASGGTGPYTGIGTFSQTAADGTVTYTVIDANGCTDDIAVTITEPAVLVAAESHTAINCNGGTSTVTITASGGTGPYTGIGTFPQTAADGTVIYTVTDANGCTDAISVTVTEPAVLVAAETHTAISCNGGTSTVTITASGGVGPYTGIGAFPQTAADGTITYTVTDANGCTNDVSVTITEPTALVAAESHTAITCNGGASTVTITASGGTGSYTGTGTFTQTAADGTVIYTVTDANGCTDNVSVTISEPAAIIFDSILKQDASCVGVPDGTIEINVSGGVPPYQYSIDNGLNFDPGNIFTPLAPGDYSLVVSDQNGCTITTQVTINVLTAIVPTIAKEDATCLGVEDGSISVSGVMGGTAPYLYSNDNGASFQTLSDFDDLPGGSNHSVVVMDDSGCLSSAFSIIINNKTSLSFGFDKTDVSSCIGDDGEIEIENEVGGTAPYEYSIDNGNSFQVTGLFTDLTPDTYQAVIRDDIGCLSGTTSVQISVIGNIVPSIAKTNADCNGVENGEINITNVTGGTPGYEFSIDNGATFQSAPAFTDLAGGVNYSVVVKDANQCISSSISVFINNTSTVAFTTTTTDVSSCVGTDGEIRITAANGTAPYQYSNDNGATFQLADLFENLSPDDYEVVVQDDNGCLSSMSTVSINIIDNILPVIRKHPASCIGIPDGVITITNVTGGTGSYEYSIDNGQTFQPTNLFEDLASGNYSVVVKDAAQCTSSVFAVIIENGLTLEMDINTKDETCTGTDGEISISNPSGGAAPYEYSIDNGVTFQTDAVFDLLEEGVYEVVVRDANGCLSPAVSTAISTDCNGGGTGGTGLCATVRITTETTPANCNAADGSATFHIYPFVPANNIIGVNIYLDGPVDDSGRNDSTFNNLFAGSYHFRVVYGDDVAPGCTFEGDFVVSKAGTVGVAEASDIVPPKCFGDSTGSVTVDVTRPTDLTGQALQWSLEPGNESSWKNFTAGGVIVGIPEGIAPSFIQTLSIRKDASDPCYTGIDLVVIPDAEEITATYRIENATCAGDDGAILEITPFGGTPNGSTYTFSIDGGAQFIGEDEFRDLNAGNYTLIVKDQADCTAEYDLTVNAPNFIKFKSETVVHAECDNNGLSGKLLFEFENIGTYRVGVSNNPLVQPEKFRTYTTSGIPLVFDSLARGDYYVWVESSGADCSIGQGPYTINGIFAIDFDIEPLCTGNDLSIALTNITGNPNEPLEVRVFKKFTNVQEALITINPFPATASFYLEKSAHAFLQNPEEYLIQLVQIEETSECFEIKSDMVEYDVPFPLDADLGDVSKSYPDVPTGKIEVEAFTGGAMPYEVRIELDSASALLYPVFETGFIEVTPDSEQQLKKQFENVPPGRYAVQVRDSLGCSIEFAARVPMDVDITIPNIMTPNEDGVNDIFFIRNLPEGKVSKLIISNRWGKIVYSSTGYQNNWTGAEAADGVYFYQLQIDGGETITGWLEIMRGQKP